MPTWGSTEVDELNLRKLFIPQRDIKYRHIGVVCKHNCLPNSETFGKELKITDRYYYTQILDLVERDYNKVFNKIIDFIH